MCIYFTEQVRCKKIIGLALYDTDGHPGKITDDIDEIRLMAKNVQLDIKNRYLKLNYWNVYNSWTFHVYCGDPQKLVRPCQLNI